MAGEHCFPGSPLNAEAPEFPGSMAWCYCDILYTDHRTIPGMGKSDKVGQRGRGALGNHFDRTVREVLHIPVNTRCLRTALDEMPVPYALHPPPRNGSNPLHRIVCGMGWFKVWEMDRGIGLFIPKKPQ
jgi:hypothetical protein